MNVLSIQSSVAYGHAGNSAAVFPLQRLGVEVWPVDTVQFSNHTGHEGWRGRAFAADQVAEVIRGIEERGAFARCDAVLSGYVGAADMARVIAGAVGRVKAANPNALYCCDPVMGNESRGLFVSEAVAEAVTSELVARADILTPNRFELARLTGLAIDNTEDALAGAEALAARGPGVVVCTSLPSEKGIGVLARAAEGAWLVETPRLEVAANGAGDAFAAILLARLLAGDGLDRALSHAVSAIFAVLDATRAAGAAELQLVAAQAEIAAPGRRFPARQLG